MWFNKDNKKCKTEKCNKKYYVFSKKRYCKGHDINLIIEELKNKQEANKEFIIKKIFIKKEYFFDYKRHELESKILLPMLIACLKFLRQFVKFQIDLKSKEKDLKRIETYMESLVLAEKNIMQIKNETLNNFLIDANRNKKLMKYIYFIDFILRFKELFWLYKENKKFFLLHSLTHEIKINGLLKEIFLFENKKNKISRRWKEFCFFIKINNQNLLLMVNAIFLFFNLFFLLKNFL